MAQQGTSFPVGSKVMLRGLPSVYSEYEDQTAAVDSDVIISRGQQRVRVMVRGALIIIAADCLHPAVD